MMEVVEASRGEEGSSWTLLQTKATTDDTAHHGDVVVCVRENDVVLLFVFGEYLRT